MLHNYEDDELKEAYGVAKRADLKINENGIPGLIERGCDRFCFTVIIHCYDGSNYCIKDCYAIGYDQWLFVFKEDETKIYDFETIDEYKMSRPVAIPSVYYYEDEDKMIIDGN
jgi:hypothetical protein